MEMLKYLSNKKIYLLINIIILGLGYFFISEGLDKEISGTSNVLVAIGTSLFAAGDSNIFGFMEEFFHFSNF